MKLQTISNDILQEKGARCEKQSADAIRRRVARALAACEKTADNGERLILAAQANGFVPAGQLNARHSPRQEWS